MTNRLAGATSPYLAQHADNPVDWYEWGPEAFERALEEDKPVFLSIGYSACHWCHVMAHESFEDEAIAAQMNDQFVNVKVDREERPDVDGLYMEAVQAMTGQGGWPLSVFLTPRGEAFYGGTYFPPEARGGMPGLPQVLDAVTQAWSDRRGEMEDNAGRLTSALRQAAQLEPSGDVLAPEALVGAAASIVGTHDRRNGGFGGAPKFPQAGVIRFLLGRYVRGGDDAHLEAAAVSLGAMARGGIYDHLGGGFHRYSVDAQWSVPHFEKMLYDNAQLARAYLEAWQLTGIAALRTVAEETLDYMVREMQAPEGGFYATQDADTAEGEGAYFTWTTTEVDEALPADEARAVQAWYGITPGGNFEGVTVLSARREPGDVAGELGLSAEELAVLVSSARPKLLATRERREPPATDTKVIVAWNGLAIDALARAGSAFGRDDYVRAATEAADLLLDRVQVGGGLAHSWKDGRADVPAFQDDYASLAAALITLYETTFEPRWLSSARALVDEMVEQFADDEDGGFFRIGARHEALIVRQKDIADGAVPSGNALAADALLRLAALTGEHEYQRRATEVFRLTRPLLDRAPMSFGAMLGTLDDYLSGMREVAIMGPPEDPRARSLLAEARRRYLPGTVLAASAGPGEGVAEAIPLLADRPLVDGAATAYVCRGHVCQTPVTEPADLAAQLDEGRPIVGEVSLLPEPDTRVAGLDAGSAPDVAEDEPVTADEATFDGLVLRSELPVLVDFWAPWCGPCRMVAPVVEELAAEYAGRARVVKLNTDEAPEVAGRYGIRGIPTLIVFKDGEEAQRLVGVQPKPVLAQALDSIIS